MNHSLELANAVYNHIAALKHATFFSKNIAGVAGVNIASLAPHVERAEKLNPGILDCTEDTVNVVSVAPTDVFHLLHVLEIGQQVLTKTM
jgi:hypothetical protein